MINPDQQNELRKVIHPATRSWMVFYYWEIGNDYSGHGRCVISNEMPLSKNWVANAESAIRNEQSYRVCVITNVIELENE